MRWSLAALALALGTQAHAGDRECRRAVRGLHRAPAATYAVTSERLPYHTATVRGLERHRERARVQWEHTPDVGPSWALVEDLTCSAGTLSLTERSRQVAPGDVERYDPPLAVLQLPLTPGASWSWEGTLTVGPSDQLLATPASAEISVGEPLTLQVAAGTWEVLPVVERLTVGDGGVITTRWVRPDAPWVPVRIERRYLAPGGVEARTDQLELTTFGR